MNELRKRKIYQRAWSEFGAVAQTVVAMEECSELIKELSKAIRGNIDGLKIAEEIADVEIMTEQIKQQLSLQAVVAGFKEDKIKRLEKILNKIASTKGGQNGNRKL